MTTQELTPILQKECPKMWEELKDFIAKNCFYIRGAGLINFIDESRVEWDVWPTILDFEGYLRGFLREKGVLVHVIEEVNHNDIEYSGEYATHHKDVEYEQTFKYYQISHRVTYETALLTAVLEAFKYLEEKK